MSSAFLLSPQGSKVMQVQSTTKTDVFTTTTRNGVDVTGLAVTITPSSASSKIMIWFSGYFATNDGYATSLQLWRDSTLICMGDASGARQRTAGGMLRTGNTTSLNKICNQFLDSPATTDELTYKIRVPYVQTSTPSSTFYFNRTVADTDGVAPRVASTIIAFEIQG